MKTGDKEKRTLYDNTYVWSLKKSILKEINPEYSLEGLMLKLKLQLLWLPDAKS